jgi:hypothetical protein
MARVPSQKIHWLIAGSSDVDFMDQYARRPWVP